MAHRRDYRRRVIPIGNEKGSKRSAVRLLKVAVARDEKGCRAAMLRERAERFAQHVKAELLAERKMKGVVPVATAKLARLDGFAPGMVTGRPRLQAR